LDDVWSSGTVVDIAVARVGRNYITSTANLVDAAGRDLFNRQLVSNRLSIGAKVTQKLGAVKLVGIADYTANADGSYNTANNNMTIEGGVGYDIIDSAELTASYRYKKDAVQTAGKDTADMLSVGLLYTF
jgi:predicted porin